MNGRLYSTPIQLVKITSICLFIRYQNFRFRCHEFRSQHYQSIAFFRILISNIFTFYDYFLISFLLTDIRCSFHSQNTERKNGKYAYCCNKHCTEQIHFVYFCRKNNYHEHKFKDMHCLETKQKYSLYIPKLSLYTYTNFTYTVSLKNQHTLSLEKLQNTVSIYRLGEQ